MSSAVTGFAQKVVQPVRDSGRMIVAQQFTAGIMSQGIVVRERTADDADILWRFQSSASRTKVLVPSVPAMNRWAIQVFADGEG
jgi:hypothetical protein